MAEATHYEWRDPIMFCCCGSGCRCCHRHCCCCCDCDCGGSGGGNGGGTSPVVPLSQFPVYVSYPAFFTGENAINGANQSIFIQPLSTTRSCF